MSNYTQADKSAARKIAYDEGLHYMQGLEVVRLKKSNFLLLKEVGTAKIGVSVGSPITGAGVNYRPFDRSDSPLVSVLIKDGQYITLEDVNGQVATVLVDGTKFEDFFVCRDMETGTEVHGVLTRDEIESLADIDDVVYDCSILGAEDDSQIKELKKLTVYTVFNYVRKYYGG